MTDVEVAAPHPSIAAHHGRLVMDARLEDGISQAALAVAAGTTQQTISRIENGTQGVSDTLKVAIAKVLRKKVGELFPLGEEDDQ